MENSEISREGIGEKEEREAQVHGQIPRNPSQLRVNLILGGSSSPLKHLVNRFRSSSTSIPADVRFSPLFLLSRFYPSLRSSPLQLSIPTIVEVPSISRTPPPSRLSCITRSRQKWLEERIRNQYPFIHGSSEIKLIRSGRGRRDNETLRSSSRFAVKRETK